MPSPAGTSITVQDTNIGVIHGSAFSHNTTTSNTIIHIHSSGKPSPKLLKGARGYIPAGIAFFHGRDAEVDYIVSVLTQDPDDESSKRARICLLGAGGNGKTSALLVVMRHPKIRAFFELDNLIWVPCVLATSVSLLIDILGASLGISSSANSLHEAILANLRSSGPVVLLLDNFETPWNISGVRQDVAQILRDIEEIPNVAVLMTIRATVAPCEGIPWLERKIGALDPEASRRVYTEIHPESASDLRLPELLDLLGHMPLAITLMARQGKSTSCTTDELISSYILTGVAMLGPSTGSDPQNSVVISIRMSVESNPVKEEPEALRLLEIISSLPAGTSFATLKQRWARYLSNLPGALRALLESSLLERRGTTFFVLPAIRSYVLDPSRFSQDVNTSMIQTACDFLNENNAFMDNPSFKEHSAVRSAEEINLQSILRATTKPDPRVIHAILILIEHQRWKTRPHVELIQHAVLLAKGGEPCHLGEVLDMYALVFLSLNRYTESLEQSKLARQAFLDASEFRLAARKLLHIATVSSLIHVGAEADFLPLIDQARLEYESIHTPGSVKLRRRDRLVRLFQRRETSTPRDGATDLDIAECLLQSGTVSLRHDPQLALKDLIRARDLFPKPSASALSCALSLGVVTYILGDYDQAEKWTMTAQQESQELGVSIAGPLHYLGRLYITQGKYSQAVQSLKDSLDNYMTEGNLLLAAHTLLELGRAWMKIGDKEEARSAFLDASKQYLLSPSERDGEILCRFYLARLDDPSEMLTLDERKALENTWHHEDIPPP
ncbi:hypothetical protein C8J56DRAFT_1156910 [Mycena floridula]|nr:hypothetical protein C8J56DRAFT_1156910 [Mycena floridula]